MENKLMQLFHTALIPELTAKYGRPDRQGDFLVWKTNEDTIVLPIYRDSDDYREIIAFALKKHAELSHISVNELKQSLEAQYLKTFKTHRINL